MPLGLPWWAKIAAKLILSRLPFGYKLWQRLGLFRHGSMDQSNYLIRVFDAHLMRTGLNGLLTGKTILELGPGDSIGTAVVAASYGAKAILIDSGAYAKKEVGLYKRIASDLASRGLSPPDLTHASTFEEVLKACNAEYMTNGLASYREIDTGSVDLIFSQAVLEHVRRHEFSQTMSECHRVLKKDGVASHRVDLKDHLDGGLNNLRFSERIWESPLFVNSGFYTNRLRCSQMIDMFQNSGFRIETMSQECWDSLPVDRSSMDCMFAQCSDDEIRIKGFEVVLRCGSDAGNT